VRAPMAIVPTTHARTTPRLTALVVCFTSRIVASSPAVPCDDVTV
jgi:hypothetical protein